MRSNGAFSGMLHKILRQIVPKKQARKKGVYTGAERLPIVTNVPKFTVVTQFDLIQSS